MTGDKFIRVERENQEEVEVDWMEGKGRGRGRRRKQVRGNRMKVQMRVGGVLP